ncbi:hypothetical protein QQS21_006801 [Conoideocrella luteorostrata]|uniref:Uncharacterized protein n=1 Tax=Conoideocrella luteorostrata TaxID=1105319 RepID=A0AAJ0CR80_9HYPO|nr:hypothetical protein QQS21_006801 [Conoideocrella luteorostrata]
MVRIFDWITGTAVSLKGRRVALTGSRGAFGKALQKELRQAKVKNIKPLVFGVDWTYEDYGQLAAIFQDIDVLIIAHGTKVDKDAWQANYLSVLTLIELFKQTRESNKLGLMPEVWFVGSEAEVHGAWTSDMVSYVNTKRAVVPYCRGFYEDDTFIYRHIVPAAFQSSMGSALVSAEWAARSTLWWIHRGARYVPVTYTGLAFINFFRFLYWVTPKIIRTGAGDKPLAFVAAGFSTSTNKYQWRITVKQPLWKVEGLDHERFAALHNLIIERGWTASDRSLSDLG